jgi:hypothetical protein
MSAEDDNQEALRRRFEAIKADRDALLQRIAEQRQPSATPPIRSRT